MNTPLRRPRAIALAVPADPGPLAAVLASVAAVVSVAVANLVGALWR